MGTALDVNLVGANYVSVIELYRNKFYSVIVESLIRLTCGDSDSDIFEVQEPIVA